MGAANVIPGVSGGTIAFITGIYERLINGIKSCDIQAIRLLLGLKFRELAAHVDMRFMIAVGLGALLSVISLAQILEHLFFHHPVLTWAFFFGLILASIWGVGKMVSSWNPAVIIASFVGLAVAIGVLWLPHSPGNTSGFYLFLCGMAAISSMIIPGVSGSFVLLIMGNYMLVLGAVGSFDAGILLPFGAGCIIGLIVLSHLLSWIFSRYHDLAVGLITGFIIGSLVLIWPWKEEVYKQDEDGAYIVRNEQREGFSRSGELQAVEEELKDGEQLVSAGYANWKLPDAGEKQTWIAILLMLAGGCSVLAIERIGVKRSRGDDEDIA